MLRGSLVIFIAGLLSLAALPAGEGNPPKNDFGDYDEVIRDLVPNLGKDTVSAQDAAFKLARLGRRSVPVLSELLRVNMAVKPLSAEAQKDPRQVAAYERSRTLVYYSALSLSRIKHPDAGAILLPILKDPKAPVELRAMALEAHGLEKLEEGGPVLREIAEHDPDPTFRRKALTQISLMPEFWVQSEKLFVNALGSPDDETRLFAAKQCYFARIYLSAGDKLVELAEKDTSEPVRTQAMLALGRMKIQRAVPMLVKHLKNDALSERERQHIVRTIVAITDIPFKDAAGVDGWWQRQGEKEFAKRAEVEAALKSTEPPPVEPARNATLPKP